MLKAEVFTSNGESTAYMEFDEFTRAEDFIRQHMRLPGNVKGVVLNVDGKRIFSTMTKEERQKEARTEILPKLEEAFIILSKVQTELYRNGDVVESDLIGKTSSVLLKVDAMLNKKNDSPYDNFWLNWGDSFLKD